MNDPVAAREAPVIEPIGDAGRLIDSIAELTTVLREIGPEVDPTAAHLEERIAAITYTEKSPRPGGATARAYLLRLSAVGRNRH